MREFDISMSNTTTFAAYAYLKEVRNPYQALCNYICYAIHMIDKESISIEEINKKLIEEFGIETSPNLIKSCISCLVSEKRVAISRITRGITLLKIGFDLERFQRERTVLELQETNFINQLIEHTFRLGVREKWTSEESRKYLGRYLLNDDLGINYAFNGTINKSKTQYLSPEWYIADYVKGLSIGSSEHNYILSVSHGLMVHIGLNETSKSKQVFEQKFRGTDFFLDTKLVLRAMGYTLPFYKKCADELIDIIRKDNQGKVKIFDHTLTEISTALHNAEKELRQSKRVKDEELNLYAIYNNCDADDFYTFYANLQYNLEKNFDITIVSSDIDWNNNSVRVNNLDWEGLEERISSDHPTWQRGTIRKDIRSINIVNHFRNGDYSQHFGGKGKFPIFVTTNTGLIASVRKFIIDNYEKGSDDQPAGLSRFRMPIISDTSLLFRLWYPQAKLRSDLPINIVAANAFVAQQAEADFYERVKNSYNKVNITHKGLSIDIDDFRHRKLEEAIVSLSHGEIDLIDETLAAQSVDEIIKVETHSIKEERDKLSTDIIEMRKEKLEQSFTWIEAYSKQLFANVKGPAYRRLIKVNKIIWPYILSIAVGMISEIVLLITGRFVDIHPILEFMPIAIAALSFAAITLISELKIAKVLQMLAESLILRKLRMKVEKQLDDVLKDNKAAIVNTILELMN